MNRAGRIGDIVYECVVQQVSPLLPTQGWSHAHRQSVEVEQTEPRLVAEAVERIGTFQASLPLSLSECRR